VSQIFIMSLSIRPILGTGSPVQMARTSFEAKSNNSCLTGGCSSSSSTSFALRIFSSSDLGREDSEILLFNAKLLAANLLKSIALFVGLTNKNKQHEQADTDRIQLADDAAPQTQEKKANALSMKSICSKNVWRYLQYRKFASSLKRWLRISSSMLSSLSIWLWRRLDAALSSSHRSRIALGRVDVLLGSPIFVFLWLSRICPTHHFSLKRFGDIILGNSGRPQINGVTARRDEQPTAESEQEAI
jgi:hypothetical protein